MSKCLFCNKSIRGSTDRLMSARIDAITRHQAKCIMTPCPKCGIKFNDINPKCPEKHRVDTSSCGLY